MCLDSQQFETTMTKKKYQLQDFRNEHNLNSDQHGVFVEKSWNELKKLGRSNVGETGMILMDEVKKEIRQTALKTIMYVKFCPL